MARWTSTELESLRVQIENELRETPGQSIRHTFYRMTNPRLPNPVPKTESGYKKVQRLLTAMRRSGRIPYGWIVDPGRRAYHQLTFDSTLSWAEKAAELYRSDFWADADCYLEVWTESESLAGVILSECKRAAVSCYPSKGFTSLSLAYAAAIHIAYTLKAREQTKARILYLGDFDPSGMVIDKRVEAELRLHLPAWVDLKFRRLLINEDQILQYDLPTKPPKDTDKRKHSMTVSVEGEAMPAQVTRDILRATIESYLPLGELTILKAVEEDEQTRGELREWAQRLTL